MAVTSEDEWYKAAYYKGGGIDAGYWDIPTSSDALPGTDMPTPTATTPTITLLLIAAPSIRVSTSQSSASSRTPRAPMAHSTRAAMFGNGPSP